MFFPTPLFSIIQLATYRRNAKDINISCPVQKGDYNVTATVALPKEIPPGKTLLLKQHVTLTDPALFL